MTSKPRNTGSSDEAVGAVEESVSASPIVGFPLHSRLTMIGGFVGYSDEEWDCSLHLTRSDNGGPVGDQAALLTQVQSLFADWFTSATSRMPATATLKRLKIAPIGHDGKYTGPAAIYQWGSALVGTATQAAPGFCSVALTMTTAKITPPGRYGRIYPPNYGAPLTDEFTVAPGVIDQMLANFKTLLNGIQATPQTPNVVQVSNRLAGVPYLVTEVSADLLYDVQRRRKNRVSAPRRRLPLV